MRASATTARSTCCAATAGRATARSRGRTEPNRGFLRCLALLALSAQGIGETDEAARCADFLRDSSPEAAAELLPA